MSTRPAQQRLALCIRRPSVSPNFGQTAGKADDLVVQCLADCHLRDALLRALASNGLLGDANLVQRYLPAALELGGDEPVIGINAVELALGKCSLVALAFQLAFRAALHRLVDLLLSPAGARQGVKLGRRQSRQECLRDGRIDTRRSQVLACRQTLM